MMKKKRTVAGSILFLCISLVILSRGMLEGNGLEFTWDFLPWTALGIMLALGAALLAIRGNAPLWWYIGIGVCLMLSSWYAYDPEFFMDFTSSREYLRGRGRGTFTHCINMSFYIPMLQLVPFIWLGLWDRWLYKTGAGWVFLTCLSACVAGAIIASIHP